MLILPLHRPLTLQTFPVVTALLVLINVFVFFGLQQADDKAMADARAHYARSGLAGLELPLYERHLRDSGRGDELATLQAATPEVRTELLAAATLTDVAFAQALARGEGFEREEDHAAWRAARAGFDAALAQVFTLRHVLRSSEVDPWRMLSSAFLHGGLGHLVGNMIFLAALGLLVEGALGAGRFAALYLLGALGSSAASLAWRWGETGGGLGASGAIAALMGAFCVIWGRQPVRFFYWFGVVFDYVRKPAIWLLPLWLGWEVFNLLTNDEAGIGFDAHAGGLICGALLGAALVHFGQVREDFIRDAEDGAAVDDRWSRAQAHLGRMQLAEADALLAELQREQPGDFALGLARWRVARNGSQTSARSQRGRELLALRAADAAGAAQQGEVLAMLQESGEPLDASVRAALVARWIELGRFDAAEQLLLADGAPDPSQAAGQWFALGLRRRAAADDAGFRRAMAALLQRHPQQPQAQKARFLLDNG